MVEHLANGSLVSTPLTAMISQAQFDTKIAVSQLDYALGQQAALISSLASSVSTLVVQKANYTDTAAAIAASAAATVVTVETYVQGTVAALQTSDLAWLSGNISAVNASVTATQSRATAVNNTLWTSLGCVGS